MSQEWYVRLGWWLCEKLEHPFPVRAWVYNGRYIRECRWCGRVVSEPLKGETK